MASMADSAVSPATSPGPDQIAVLKQEALSESPARLLWLCRLLIALLVLITFSPALKHALLPWDDQSNITRNPLVVPPSAPGLARLWSAPYDGLYVPLVYTTFAAEAALTGGDGKALARLIHLNNLLLHALAALIVFELLRRLLVTTVHARTALWAACAGALLFALHPLQAEAVNWATGRKDLLCGALALLSLHQYLRWRQMGGARRYALALAAFALALLAKPAAAAVPLAAAALDFYALRRPAMSSFRALWPWFAAALLFAGATARIQYAAEATAEPLAPPAWTRPFVAADAAAFYMEKILLPRDLSPVYTRSVNAVVADRRLLLLALPLVAIPLVLLLTRRNLVGAGSATALALLLPTLGLVPFHYQNISTVADRYAYTAMFGVALAVAAGGLPLATGGKRRSALTACASTLAILCLAGMSWRQSGYWRSSETLWSHAARVASGSAVVRNNLGMTHGEIGRSEDALREFAEAVRLDPEFASAHNNLANLYKVREQQEKAAEHYQKALDAEPRHVVARTNLMLLHHEARQITEAGEHARRLLEMDPDNLMALNIRAIALGTDGKGAQALKLLREAASRKPDNTELQALLGQAEQIMAADGK